jgi:flavin-dependent dehydrogenase
MEMLEAASKKLWDVVVVGAGPAGAIAARELARNKVSVLLVDKARFPRPKVCGSCFNQAALGMIEEVGLGSLPRSLGAKPTRELFLSAGDRKGRIPLPEGLALSREVFDAALIREAVREGVHFLPGTRAQLSSLKESTRTLKLSQENREHLLETRLVLGATGLGGNFLENEKDLEPETAPASRVGVGAISSVAPSFYSEGTIFMACSRGGYVGLVRLEDGRLDLAAALDPMFLKEWGGADGAVRQILLENGFPWTKVEALEWRGTPPLTHRRVRLAAERLFVLGDAASFVEPFTGEGIAWALASGVRIVPLARRALEGWNPLLEKEWANLYTKLLGKRQKVCGWVTKLLRRVSLTRAVITLLSWKPELGKPLVEFVNASF